MRHRFVPSICFFPFVIFRVLALKSIVIEVKVQKFNPADVGQIGTYMVAVNHQLKQPGDQQTVGLIICREKDRVTVQYALESSSRTCRACDATGREAAQADLCAG